MDDPNSPKFQLGVALAHYHAKLGPQFIGESGELDIFDPSVQLNMLQDSVASRTSEIALFITDRRDRPFIVRIHKLIVEKAEARGGVLRYALLVFFPFDGVFPSIALQEMVEDFSLRLRNSQSVGNLFEKWKKALIEVVYNQDRSFSATFTALKSEFHQG